MSTDSKSTTPDPERTGWDITRWILALLVALAAAAFYLHALDHQSLCHQELSGEFPKPLEVCGSPRLLDLAPFALIISVLLWPDLGELAVAGLFTLRRRVDQQQERQESVESRLTQVDQQLTQLATLSQVQSQNQNANPTINVYPPDQEVLRRGIDAREAEAGADDEDEAEEPQEEAPPVPRGMPGDGDAERQRLLGEFMREYARLEPFILPPGNRLARELESLDATSREQVMHWREMFDREINALRQTRNSAVHQPELVSPATLSGAIANTRELSRILFGRIG